MAKKGNMKEFHESMKDLRIKIERFMLQYGNSMGKMDNNHLQEILGDSPGFRQNTVNICRIIAWNVCVNAGAPELDAESTAWANAMRTYKHAPEFPAVYNMSDETDLRHLNAMAHLAYESMRKESPLIQAQSYKTLEDLKRFASDYEACTVERGLKVNMDA